MSVRAVALSFTLACAVGGAWAALSLATGSPYAFIGLGVGVLAGIGVTLVRVEEPRRLRLAIAAACIAAFAIFTSRFAVMYVQAGSAELAAIGSSPSEFNATPIPLSVGDRLRRIDQAGGVHGDLGFTGLLWVALGSLIAFKVATLGEPVLDENAESELDPMLVVEGLLSPSCGMIALTAPLAAPKDDGLPSLSQPDHENNAPARFVLAGAYRQAA